MSSSVVAVGRVGVCLFFSVYALFFFFVKGSLISLFHLDCWGEGLYLEVLDGTKKSL